MGESQFPHVLILEERPPARLNASHLHLQLLPTRYIYPKSVDDDLFGVRCILFESSGFMLTADRFQHKDVPVSRDADWSESFPTQ